MSAQSIQIAPLERVVKNWISISRLETEMMSVA